MGVLIVAEEPLSRDAWTHVEFFRSEDGGSTWNKLGEKQIDFDSPSSFMWYDKTGSSSYLYTFRFKNVNDGTTSDPAEAIDVKEEVYTTIHAVARLLGISPAYLVERFPNVVDLIQKVEDYIDNRLQTTWKSKQTTEYYTPIQTFSIEGYVIFTKYRPIISIDKLEVWNGSSWEDWKQTRTEGRSSDYWVDYENGEVFILTSFLPLGFLPDKLQVRITYTYGKGATTSNRDNVIPKDLELIATKLVAVEILTNEDYRGVLPSGENQVSLERKIEIYQNQIDEWFSRQVRWIPVGQFR